MKMIIDVPDESVDSIKKTVREQKGIIELVTRDMASNIYTYSNICEALDDYIEDYADNQELYDLLVKNETREALAKKTLRNLQYSFNENLDRTCVNDIIYDTLEVFIEYLQNVQKVSSEKDGAALLIERNGQPPEWVALEFPITWQSLEEQGISKDAETKTYLVAYKGEVTPVKQESILVVKELNEQFDAKARKQAQILDDDIVRQQILDGLDLQASFIFNDVDKEYLSMYADQANAILAVYAYYGKNRRIEDCYASVEDEPEFKAMLVKDPAIHNFTEDDKKNIQTLIREELLEHFQESGCEAWEYQREATAYLQLMRWIDPQNYESAQEEYNERVREEERPDYQLDLTGKRSPESKRYIELYESFYDYSLEIPTIDAKIARTMKQERYSTERIIQAIQTNSPVTVDDMNPTYAQDVALGRNTADLTR